MFRQYIKPAIIMVAVIILCAILARVLSGNETLAEYAQKHPEIAYGGSNESESADSYLPISDGDASNKQ
ncbi:hypothetical protein [Butyrivibrio sp. JL13D10]|uniref:hypothetical protein n=1 Tax=Butyrivibrio sp. JL13D10 TaxID=3236815 RepID=UPI0038B5C371